jgi:hypothetical protein
MSKGPLRLRRIANGQWSIAKALSHPMGEGECSPSFGKIQTGGSIKVPWDFKDPAATLRGHGSAAQSVVEFECGKSIIGSFI